MSLLEELESQGVTAEDLEKAASVRLFEKAAAAEGVDLDSLDVDQVEELYASFLSNQSYDDGYTKEASAMNDEIIDLFEKTAAAEGIDLEEMADDELAELYNHYVESVLPEQIEEYEKEAAYYEDGGHEIDEATEKLAEAEILGRHMARAYVDELDELEKDAGAKKMIQKGIHKADMALRGLGRGTARTLRKIDKKKRLVRGNLTRKNTQRLYGAGAVGAGTAAVGGAGYAAKKQMEKESSALDEMDVQALLVIANEVGVDEALEASDLIKEAKVMKAVKAGVHKADMALRNLGRGTARMLRKVDKKKRIARGNLTRKKTQRLYGAGAVGAGTAAVGGAGYGAKKLMDKESSYEDDFFSGEDVYEYALEILDVLSEE